jgi:gluconate 5-dehydrogenase
MSEAPSATAPAPLPELFSLKGRVALVTGSAQGLGLAMAEGLAQMGAVVYLNGRSPDRLDEARRQLRGRGAEVKTAPFDVTDPAAGEAALAAIADSEGRLDILVNNVGPRLRRPIGEIDDDGIRRMLDAHVVTPFRLAKLAAEHMKRGGYGRIIMVASAAAIRGTPNDAAYTAAKGGVVSLTRALALEFGAFGITCNTLVPGRFETESNQVNRRPANTPLRRWAEPAEIAGACAFLASPAAAYVTAVALEVDGGVTNCFPPSPTAGQSP